MSRRVYSPLAVLLRDIAARRHPVPLALRQVPPAALVAVADWLDERPSLAETAAAKPGDST